MLGSSVRLQLADWLERLRETGYRGLVVLHSEATWLTVDSLASLLRDRLGDVLCVLPSTASVECERTSPSAISRRLGSEYGAVVIGSRELLRPNTVAAAAEMVRGGGVLALVVPPVELWKPGGAFTTGLYKRYLIESFARARSIFWASVGRGTVHAARLPPRAPSRAWNPRDYRASSHVPRVLVEAAATYEQAQLLDEAVGFLRRRGRTVVVVGDRGRGKSGLLALITAFLIVTKQVGFVPVTAPSPHGLVSFFTILSMALRRAGVRHWVVEKKGVVVGVAGPWFHVRYHTPEAVEPGAFTVVDEAAAIGPLRIRRIIRRATRLLVATTVHGYEGSGKAFAKTVLGLLPQPRLVLEPREPIRYPPGDPLEEWLYDTFLLDAEPPPPTVTVQPQPETIGRERLVEDRRLLRNLYAVITQAHYRNEPDDLAMMIDAWHHTLHALSADSFIIAAAELAWDDCSLPVNARILVDLLLNRAPEDSVCTTRGARVVRIAVHPDLQNRGYGTRLLAYLEEWGRSQALDWLGAVFGRVEVVRFWLRNGYYVVHVSPLPSRVTGEKNIAVLKPLTPKAHSVIVRVAQELRYHLLLAAPTLHRDLPAEVLAEILTTPQLPPFKDAGILVSPGQMHQLQHLAEGKTDFEAVLDALYALVVNATLREGRLPLEDKREAIAVTARVLQGKSIDDTAYAIHASREEAKRILREAARKIVEKTLGFR